MNVIHESSRYVEIKLADLKDMRVKKKNILRNSERTDLITGIKHITVKLPINGTYNIGRNLSKRTNYRADVKARVMIRRLREV